MPSMVAFTNDDTVLDLCQLQVAGQSLPAGPS